MYQIPDQIGDDGKSRSVHVKISDNTWNCKRQNELSVRRENGDYCRNALIKENPHLIPCAEVDILGILFSFIQD